MMRFYYILLIFILGCYQLFSQDISTTEIKVVENFIPSVLEADRLNENAVFLDTIKSKRKQNFNIFKVQIDSDYNTRPLKPAKVKSQKIPQLFSKRVSLGTGYQVTSKFNAIYNTIYSKDISTGIIINHFSDDVYVEKKYAGKQLDNIHMYIKSIQKNVTIRSTIDYNRLAFFSYGKGVYDKKNYDNSITQNNPFLNRFAYSKMYFSLQKNNKKNDYVPNQISFFITDLNEFSENQINLKSFLKKSLDSLLLSYNLEYNNFLNYKNKDNVFETKNVHTFSFIPSTLINRYSLKIELAFPVYYESEFSKFKVFPQVILNKELVRHVLYVKGGLRHKNYRNTFKSISEKNPYIHSYGTNQSIINDSVISQKLLTTYNDELFFSMSNMLSKNDELFFECAYSKIDNYPYFSLVDNGYYDRFKVNYLESLAQFKFTARYSRDFGNLVNTSLLLEYFKRDKQVDHNEDLFVNIDSQINLRDKIYLSPSLHYKGKRRSYDRELSPVLYFNFNILYNYSKQLSGYLSLQNLTNSKSEIWDSYKGVGFNMVVGVKYSF